MTNKNEANTTKDNFWNDLPKPFFILAPMEAVTDVVFRHVIAHAARPDVFFTEFTNTNSWCSPKGQHSTRGRLEFTEDEQPMVAHIWGDVPEYFAKMSRDMKDLGFKGIDINMGCPAPNVARKGCGCGLIKNPDLASEIINAAKEGGLPVSVKTRLGYTRIDEWQDWIRHLLEQDIANLTIHLRTKKEMSKVDAHHELISDILAMRDQVSPNTLITINGDIHNRSHGLELTAANPGIDGVMIGRGVFKNPYAFENQPTQHSKQELLDLLRLQLDLFDKYSKDNPRKFDPLKRFFKIYVNGFDGAADLRDKLMHTNSTEEVRELLP